MAKQDDYVRITLRIPPDLHAKLVERAGTKSLNAEILERLEASIEHISIDPIEYDKLRNFDSESLHSLIDKIVDDKINHNLYARLKKAGVKGLIDLFESKNDTIK